VVVVAMLAHDATIAMPPAPTWYRGQDAAASFLRGIALAADKRWRLVRVNANGQPAFGEYLWHERTQHYVAEAVTCSRLPTIRSSTLRRSDARSSSLSVAYQTTWRRRRARLVA
jgi:hypothetical protein